MQLTSRAFGNLREQALAKRQHQPYKWHRKCALCPPPSRRRWQSTQLAPLVPLALVRSAVQQDGTFLLSEQDKSFFHSNGWVVSTLKPEVMAGYLPSSLSLI